MQKEAGKLRRVLPLRQDGGFPYLLITASVLLVYSNIYNNTFVLDDKLTIVDNDLLRHWGSLPDLLTSMTGRGVGFFRPVQMLLYFLVYQAFGLSQPAFHALNVILHTINALLVFRLGCRLGFKAGAAFCAALLWAVHPLHTEAVTYISSTADPLFCLFCLLGIHVLLPDFSMRRIWFACGLFLCALGSKESAVVFPALATACLFLVSKKRGHIATYFRTWPLWCLSLAYITITLTFYSLHKNLVFYDPQNTAFVDLYVHNIVNRILTCFASIPVFIGLLVWPENLYMDRDVVITTSLSWSVIAGMAAALAVIAQILCRKTQKTLALSWGFLWFMIAQSPNTGILTPVNGVIGEHWMYLPSIGLFLGMAQTAALYLDTLKSKKIATASCMAAVAVSLLLGIRAYAQNTVWHDEIGFYEHILACGSHSGRAHVKLTLLYAAAGEFDKAIENAQAAINHPAPMPLSSMPELHVDLALMYLRARPENTDNGIITIAEINRVLPSSSQIPEAIEELRKALALDPGLQWAQQVLNTIYAYQSASGAGK